MHIQTSKRGPICITIFLSSKILRAKHSKRAPHGTLIMPCRGCHAPSLRHTRQQSLCRQCHQPICRYWDQNSSRRQLSSATRQARAKHVLHCISGAPTCHDGEHSSGNVKESSECEELCLLRRAWLIAGAGTSLGLGTGEMTAHLVFCKRYPCSIIQCRHIRLLCERSLFSAGGLSAQNAHAQVPASVPDSSASLQSAHLGAGSKGVQAVRDPAVYRCGSSHFHYASQCSCSTVSVQFLPACCACTWPFLLGPRVMR